MPDWLSKLLYLFTAPLSKQGKPIYMDDPVIHRVHASSFADPADVRRFRACKAAGKSDQECFKVGDNGVGCWGDDTTTAVPMLSLIHI